MATATLSRLLLLAAQHGGTYRLDGVGRWPWAYPIELARDDSVNCSSLATSVLVELFGARPTLTQHRLFVLSCTAEPWGPLRAAHLLRMTSPSATGVRLHQAWRRKPLESPGHTWIEIDGPDGPLVVDATPTLPWGGVRVAARRPRIWTTWMEEQSVSLDVDKGV